VKRAWVYLRYVGMVFFVFRGQWVTSTAYLAVNLVLLGVDGPCSISKVLDASINDDLNG
jgi:hypothetical protein